MGNPACARMCMDDPTVWNRSSPLKDTHCILILLCELTEAVKYIETESRLGAR